MNPGFWNRRKVFITGHTGFKGSWLSLWLQHLGAQVTGFALEPPSNPSHFKVANVADGMVSLHGDIRNLEQVSKALEKSDSEIVVHMAAQAIVRDSYEQPVATYDSNVMGTVNVLEAIRCTPSVKAAIVVTSDKCYENREWDWGYRENDSMGGHDPYSNSKGCAELVTAAYRKSFFNNIENPIAVATVRAGNVIGGGDWAKDRLVPDMVRAIATGCPVLIRNPCAIRPWQHVLEPLSGYLVLARKLYEDGLSYTGGWNFGPRDEDAREVQWIVEQFTDLWGGGATWETDSFHHPHEANYLKLDCSKAKNRLKWNSKWDLAQAIEKIVAWHKAFLDGKDMHEVTLNQINTYEDLLIK